MTYQVLRFFMFVVMLILFVIIAKPNGLKFIEFMFNKRGKWYNEKIQKPRLLFHIIGFIFMSLAFLPLKDYTGVISFNGWGGVLLILYITVFSFGVVISLFSWSDRFEKKYIGVLGNIIENRYKIIFRDDIDPIAETNALREITETSKSPKISEDSMDDQILLLQNKEISNKIEWISLGNLERSEYISMFPFFNRVVKNGIYSISDEKVFELASFICDNYYKENTEYIKDGPFTISNVIRTYRRWKKKEEK